MRRHDIVTGILLILSIIDFALAAPVLVQEKRQARARVVHMPKDVITVSGKRWEEELEKLGEDYFKTSKPVESSSTHSSSISAPNPAPAPSTVNPDPLMEQSCSPSSSPMQSLSARGNCMDFIKLFDAPDPSTLSDSSSDYVPYEPHSDSDSDSTSSSDWEYDRSYWTKPGWVKPGDPPPRPIPTITLPPKPPPRPRPKRPPPPKQFDQAHRYKVDPLDLPSTSGHAPGPPPILESDSVVHLPSPSAGFPTEPGQEVVSGSLLGPDPELHWKHLSLNGDSQPPVDPQAAATYEAKGKVKLSGRISGTARDVG
ncbi:hypothetical protein BGY98DRAFT_1006721, partial [Russula aff. rugulosa BPL654]